MRNSPTGDVDMLNPPKGGTGTTKCQPSKNDQDVELEAVKSFAKTLLEIVYDFRITLDTVSCVSDDMAMRILAEAAIQHNSIKLGCAFDPSVIEFIYKES